MLSNIILKLPNNSELILLGDFNIDLRKKKHSSSKQLLHNFSRQFHLDQLIMKPTRITETSETMIDLIFVNNSQRIVRNDVIPCSLSDHSLVFCVFKAGVTKAPPRTIEYRCYKHYNKQSFLLDHKNVNWSTFVDENDVDATVNSWCQCFTESMFYIADMHTPMKKMKVKGISIPWMTAELSRAMQDRDYHLKKAQKTQSQHHWSSYRKLRCFVNKAVRVSRMFGFQNSSPRQITFIYKV